MVAAFAVLLVSSEARAYEAYVLPGEWRASRLYPGDFSQNLYGCSVTGASCHFIDFQSSYVTPVGEPDRVMYPVTGYRWKSEHQFTKAGYFDNPTLELYVRYWGGMPPDQPESTRWGVDHQFSSCLSVLALCSGAVSDREITETTPWYGGFDGLQAIRAYVSVSYDDGTSERILLRRVEQSSLAAVVPEPPGLALLLTAPLLAFAARMRQRRAR